jgi:predicted amidophosphoribosyltransferase
MGQYSDAWHGLSRNMFLVLVKSVLKAVIHQLKLKRHIDNVNILTCAAMAHSNANSCAGQMLETRPVKRFCAQKGVL